MINSRAGLNPNQVFQVRQMAEKEFNTWKCSVLVEEGFVESDPISEAKALRRFLLALKNLLTSKNEEKVSDSEITLNKDHPYNVVGSIIYNVLMDDLHELQAPLLNINALNEKQKESIKLLFKATLLFLMQEEVLAISEDFDKNFIEDVCQTLEADYEKLKAQGKSYAPIDLRIAYPYPELLSTALLFITMIKYIVYCGDEKNNFLQRESKNPSLTIVKENGRFVMAKVFNEYPNQNFLTEYPIISIGLAFVVAILLIHSMAILIGNADRICKNINTFFKPSSMQQLEVEKLLTKIKSRLPSLLVGSRENESISTLRSRVGFSKLDLKS